MHGGSGWNAENHGATKSWKTWRKLHHAFNADTGDIVGFKLTTKHVGDETARPVLIGEIDAGVDRLLADGAYDGGWGAACLAGMLGHEIEIIVPLPKNAVSGVNSQRDWHIDHIAEHGRSNWQKKGDTLRCRQNIESIWEERYSMLQSLGGDELCSIFRKY